MGEGPYRNTTSEDTEDNGLGSCEAHVSISPEEDRRLSESAMGENKSAAEKGCLEGGLAQWERTMFH